MALLMMGAKGIREAAKLPPKKEAAKVLESGLVLEGVDNTMSGGEPLQEVPAAPWKKKVGFTTFFI
jgi:hypothetical protein